MAGGRSDRFLPSSIKGNRKQCRPGFELWSPIPFPTLLTVTLSTLNKEIETFQSSINKSFEKNDLNFSPNDLMSKTFCSISSSLSVAVDEDYLINL